MSTKKVAFGTKPTNRPAPEMVDLWVDNRTEDQPVPEPMKRLTQTERQASGFSPRFERSGRVGP